MKKIRFIDYQEELCQLLKDPSEAIGSLKATALEDDQRVFVLALSDVIKAHGGDASAFTKEVSD